MPLSFATLITFVVSGALHDLAVSLVKWHVVIFFTPWFAFMGLAVIFSSKMGISYAGFSWYIRALINVSLIIVTLCITYFMQSIDV